MSPVAIETFDHERVSGRRPVSDHFRFVTHLIDREIRVGHAGLSVWSWKHSADFTISKSVLFSGVGYDSPLDFLRIFAFAAALNWVCRFCAY